MDDLRADTDPYAEQDAADNNPWGRALRASTSGDRSSATSSERKPLRPKISRETQAVITELCSRYPLAATETPETAYARQRLLMEDMATVDPNVLRLAIQSGTTSWRFLPTAGELMTWVQAEYDKRRADAQAGTSREQRNQDRVTAANMKLSAEGSPLRWSATGDGPWFLDTLAKVSAPFG